MAKKSTATQKASQKTSKAEHKKPDSKKPFEQTLWDTADKLRGTVESSEYKHVVLSLIFLKFVSDRFEQRRQAIIDDGQADYIMANPPFNLKAWRGPDELTDDPRWNGYEVPPTGNANYGWILHMISKLSEHGVAGFVLANGSMSTSTSGEGAIRQKIIENDLVDCMIVLPGQLFYTTQIPVCLWFLTKSKTREVKGHSELNQTVSFEDEFLAMLRKHDIKFDERYVFE